MNKDTSRPLCLLCLQNLVSCSDVKHGTFEERHYDVAGVGVIKVKGHGVLLKTQYPCEDHVVEVFNPGVILLCDDHVITDEVDGDRHLT